jgi:hypothetical protein
VAIFNQVLCFFYDGTSRHLAYFDELREDMGYARVIESRAEEMVSSHQVERFFDGIFMDVRKGIPWDSEADVFVAVTDREA